MVGRVVGAHGLRGGLRVRHFAEDPESLLALRRVELEGHGAEAGQGREVRRVAPGRPGEVRLELAGVESREQALALRGRIVRADPRELTPLGAGEYYGYQLLGCRVEGEDGSAVGTVREIWGTGASDLLVVEGSRGERHLVPAALLRRLDGAERRIVVEVLPGLLESKARRAAQRGEAERSAGPRESKAPQGGAAAAQRAEGERRQAPAGRAAQRGEAERSAGLPASRRQSAREG